MPTKLTADAKGIYVIAATPFLDDGRIDFDSIDRLVDFYLKCGVHGMTVLGVMGEFQKLAESETMRRRRALHQTRRRAHPDHRRGQQSWHQPTREDCAQCDGSRRRRSHGHADGGIAHRRGGARLYARRAEGAWTVHSCLRAGLPTIERRLFLRRLLPEDGRRVSADRHVQTRGIARSAQAVGHPACVRRQGTALYTDPVRQRRHPPAPGIPARRRRRHDRLRLPRHDGAHARAVHGG